jgi:hypothetical protein
MKSNQRKAMFARLHHYVMTPKTPIYSEGRSLVTVIIPARNEDNAHKRFSKTYHTKGNIVYDSVSQREAIQATRGEEVPQTRTEFIKRMRGLRR